MKADAPRRDCITDLLEAEIERQVVFGLLAGDAPTQVDVDQVDTMLLQPLAQGGEDHLDEMIALRVHVAKGARDEDADGFPCGDHVWPPSVLGRIPQTYSLLASGDSSEIPDSGRYKK